MPSLAPFAAPQPLRLLTTDWCSVELVAGYSHDLSVIYKHNVPTTSCYHTVLHWYGSDGTHAKLDIRKIIRKSVKDVRIVIEISNLLDIAQLLLIMVVLNSRDLHGKYIYIFKNSKRE